jgi:ribosomal protein S18 acetylase RimI-like enzyme
MLALLSNDLTWFFAISMTELSPYISINQLSVDDAEELQPVALKAYNDHYLHLWYDKGEWYIDKSFSLTALQNELHNTNSLFYLVYYKQQPAGFLKLNVDAPLIINKNIIEENALELERIYLAKEVTGKGIGKALMMFTENIALAKHKKCIWLKVMDSSNEAIAFYKKTGFEICGTYVLPFTQMKEEYRGMFIMQKNI